MFSSSSSEGEEIPKWVPSSPADFTTTLNVLLKYATEARHEVDQFLANADRSTKLKIYRDILDDYQRAAEQYQSSVKFTSESETSSFYSDSRFRKKSEEKKIDEKAVNFLPECGSETSNDVNQKNLANADQLRRLKTYERALEQLRPSLESTSETESDDSDRIFGKHLVLGKEVKIEEKLENYKSAPPIFHEVRVLQIQLRHIIPMLEGDEGSDRVGPAEISNQNLGEETIQGKEDSLKISEAENDLAKKGGNEETKKKENEPADGKITRSDTEKRKENGNEEKVCSDKGQLVKEVKELAAALFNVFEGESCSMLRKIIEELPTLNAQISSYNTQKERKSEENVTVNDKKDTSKLLTKKIQESSSVVFDCNFEGMMDVSETLLNTFLKKDSFSTEFTLIYNVHHTEAATIFILNSRNCPTKFFSPTFYIQDFLCQLSVTPFLSTLYHSTVTLGRLELNLNLQNSKLGDQYPLSYTVDWELRVADPCNRHFVKKVTQLQSLAQNNVDINLFQDSIPSSKGLIKNDKVVLQIIIKLPKLEFPMSRLTWFD